MRERGFILQPTYRIESGRPVVCIYGRLESGRPFLVRDTRQKPQFFVREADAGRARALGAAPLTETDKVTMTGERVLVVEVPTPGDAPPLRDKLIASGVVCLEADVRFAMRYLIERGIRGSLEITGEGRFPGPSLEDRRSGIPRGVRAPAISNENLAIDVASGGVESPAMEPRSSRGGRTGAGAGAGGRGLVVFENPDLTPADWTPTLSVLSFDIETDPAARRLLAISLHGCGASEVLLFAPKGMSRPAGAVSFPSERDLLSAFCARVRELDPDVLTGWNVVDFDLSVLARLAGRLGTPFEPGRGPGALRLQPARGVWGSSQASIPGRVVLDGIALLRGAFVRMEDYSLDAVSREVLGEGKTLAGKDRAGEILRMFKDDRERFVEYGLTDARLALEIVEKLRLVELAVERSRLTGMPPDRVAASIASFEFLYLSELSKRKIVAPTVGIFTARGASTRRPASGTTSAETEAGEPRAPETTGGTEPTGIEITATEPTAIETMSIETPVAEPSTGGAEEEESWAPTTGGYVLEPEPGLYRNVLVFDFKSLYPSLIRTFNIDPLGYLAPSHRAARDPSDDPIVAPNGAAFRRGPAILPGLLDDLFPRRERAKKERDPVTSNAIKILMNSFYGVLGTPACRFYNSDIANAITGFGREMLLWSKARIEGYGHRVLYGDTDSLFVLSGAEDSAAARGLGERLVRDLNRDLVEHVRAGWRVESKMELEFEELYLRLLLFAVRHGTGGARKRYAGLVEEKGARRVVFTGMEAVRRDWTDLARHVQRELYERLFSDRPVEEYLRSVVADLRAGRFDDQLVYRKALRKSPESYTASTPPHVAAARKMKTKPGRLISYVITSAGPEPAGEARSPLDHEHYVQKQIRPIAEPVLAHTGGEFDRIVGDDTQGSLF